MLILPASKLQKWSQEARRLNLLSVSRDFHPKAGCSHQPLKPPIEPTETGLWPRSIQEQWKPLVFRYAVSCSVELIG